MNFVQVDSKTIDNCVRCASDMWQSAHDCRPSLPIGMRFKQIMVEDWHECVLEIKSIGNGIQQQEEQAMTWEYAVFSRTNQPELSEFLNTCGNNGWELVSVVFAHNCYTAFLKRIKPAAQHSFPLPAICKSCSNTGYVDREQTLFCRCELGRAKAGQLKEQS